MRLAQDSAAYLEELRRLQLPARSVEEIRARYRHLCAHFAGAPPDVRHVENLPGMRHYWNHANSPVLVWFHGGRMISGDLETHDGVCRRLAYVTGWQVLAVDYRLGPEHPFPAALEDAATAVHAAEQMAPRVALGGDSAGASLALSAATEWTTALVLVYPMVDATCAGASHQEFRTGPGTSGEDIRYGYDQWLPPGTDPHDPRVSPLFDARLSKMPRALVVTCGVDPLRDEGLLLRDRLARASHLHFEDEIHGFLTYPARFAAAGQTIDAIARFLNTDAA